MTTIRTFGKLYAEPSFVEGMARTMDLFNTLRSYNEAPTEAEADCTATADDWQTVGRDLRVVITAYEKERRASN